MKRLLETRGANPVQCPSAPTPDVKDRNAVPQCVDQTRRQRQDAIDQHGHDRLTAVFGHHLVEALVPRVRQVASPAEAFENLVLDRAQQRDILREDREIIGCCFSRQ